MGMDSSCALQKVVPTKCFVCFTWAEQVGFVPVLGVMVNRPHVDQNTSPTTDGVTPNAAGEGKSLSVFSLDSSFCL